MGNSNDDYFKGRLSTLAYLGGFGKNRVNARSRHDAYPTGKKICGMGILPVLVILANPVYCPP